MNKKKDDKLKPLIPTLRLKKRFIKVQIESKNKFEFKALSENLIETITWQIGVIDFGKHGIWILKDKFNEDKQELVIKVSTKLKDKLIMSLCTINKIKDFSVKLNIIKVSGTLKGLEKK